MARSTDITSFTDLRKNLRQRLDGVRESGRPLFVTTNGGQANTWDGGADYAGLTQSDAVQLRISPLMTFSHLTPTETLYATMIPNDPDSVEFRTDLQTALNTANIAAPLVSLNTPGFFPDQWTQDFFETGYMMMPGVGGPHTMKVFIRSANVYEPQDEANPLREAGKLVFTQLRGADSAGLQQFERGASAEATLDSFGNYETIPPYSHQGVDYPLGRQLRGNVPSFHPDTSFTRMMEAQAVQPPVYVDTSWLLVAHIDETVSFIPVDSPRGWALLVNDPRLAKTILEAQVDAGNGAALMFPGMNTWGGSRRNPMLIPASRTIDQVLADTAVMGESLSSALEVDAQLAIIQAATGLTEAEIIRVPFLHEPVGGGSLAYQPGTVNGVLLTDKVFASPDPHGPVIDGKDIFKTQLENALAPFGVSVAWVEDWYLYHINAGEVHCGSNSMRAIPEARWWESGR